MKALVTGATGFVGSRLARRLVKDGHSVAILARETSGLHELEPVLRDIRVHRLDAAPDAIARAVATERPDIVFHLATYFVFDHKPEDLKPLIESNILFPLQLVDAMARAGVRFFVNTGSAWQHFEDKNYDPVCLHAATKQAFEDLLAYFVASGKIACITLKLNDTYGPNDPRRKIFTLLREAARNGQPLKMSAGAQAIDLVHIDDVVRAYLAAAARLIGSPVKSEDYVVSSGSPLPLRELVELYLEVAGTKLAIEWGARPYREREVMVPWTKGRPVPGWKPEVPLRRGLKERAEASAKSVATA